jgi:Fe-S cluster assembly protein SufD
MAAQVLAKSVAEQSLEDQFESRKDLASSPRRAAAFRRFATRGLPTRRVESWHYTDLRAAMADAAAPAPTPDALAIETARQILADRQRLGVCRLVLVNGWFVGELSEPPPRGALVERREPVEAVVDDPLAALNEAMSVGGFALRFADGADIGEAIEIAHIATADVPSACFSRIEIVVGPKAKGAVVEAFAGARPGLQRHPASVMRLAEGARLTHAAMIEDDCELHVESQIVELEAKAELNAFGLVSGGALTRRQMFVKLVGEEAKVALGGLALLAGSRRADTTLQVVHAAPRGTSREFYRAIVADDGIGVFQGKVVVESAAQKTDGAMKSQAILLSPRAQMNAKPELEIFADDVVCGHGATVSALDPEQVFYLQTRGIPTGEAEAMLLEAFGQDAIERFGAPGMVPALTGSLRTWLETRKPQSAEASP